MKNLLKKIIISICIVLGITLTYLLINEKPTFADSGWDIMYDSGSSSVWSSDYDSYSGSSSFGSDDYIFDDDDYYYDRDDYNYRRNNIIEEIKFYAFCIAIFLLVIGAIFILPVILEPIKKYFKKIKYNNSKIENKIKQYIPYFDTNDFLEGCFYVYSNVQKAWMLFKIDYVKNMLTDELFSKYKSELVRLVRKNEQNILKDFNVIEKMIKDATVENDIITITTEFKIELYDYMINQSTQELVRGSKDKKVIVVYEMKFCKDLKDEKSKWHLSEKKVINQDYFY